MALELLHSHKDPSWLGKTLKSLDQYGYSVVEGVVDLNLLRWTREALYRVRDEIQKEMGQKRLERAGGMGVLRLMMRFEPGFTRFLELPEVLALVDATVSPTAILHLQNGFILPSHPPGHTPQVFQNQFHMDFPAGPQRLPGRRELLFRG